MRKILLGLMSIMLLAFAIYVVISGFAIGSIEVNSISAIKEENANLDQKISKATNLKEIDQKQAEEEVEKAYKQLVTEKENYEQLLEIGVDENGLPINKIQEYEIEKIWVTMGNHAKKQGVDLKMDITSNNTVSQTYDLNFTVSGGYIQITDFLYSMERDSTLVFKIENFKLVPGESTDVLAATFVCKDIKLKISEITNLESKKENNENADGQNANKEQAEDKKEETTNSVTNTQENKQESQSSNKTEDASDVLDGIDM